MAAALVAQAVVVLAAAAAVAAVVVPEQVRVRVRAVLIETPGKRGQGGSGQQREHDSLLGLITRPTPYTHSAQCCPNECGAVVVLVQEQEVAISTPALML